MAKVALVLHNVYSVQRLLDTAKVAYAFPKIVDVFIVSKASGAAAQSGVPEAHKLAYRLGRAFLCVPDLKDAVDLMTPQRVFMVTPVDGALSLKEVMDAAHGEGRVMVVLSGSDAYFTKPELALGEPVYVDNVEGPLGCVAEAAIILYAVASTIIKA